MQSKTKEKHTEYKEQRTKVKEMSDEKSFDDFEHKMNQGFLTNQTFHKILKCPSSGKNHQSNKTNKDHWLGMKKRPSMPGNLILRSYFETMRSITRGFNRRMRMDRVE